MFHDSNFDKAEQEYLSPPDGDYQDDDFGECVCCGHSTHINDLLETHLGSACFDCVEKDEAYIVCEHCNGSGEGMYDGTICTHCKNTGVKNHKKGKYYE